MEKIDINSLLENNFSGFSNYNKLVKFLIVKIITIIMRVNKINEFIEKHKSKRGIEFIDDLFETLDFSYLISDKDKNRIPSEGKLIIVANHPLGGLDGLALVKMIHEVRKDVKIVVNNVLMHIKNLDNFFLPYDVFNKTLAKNSLETIQKCLENEEAIIFFPAGEVSRYKFNGIKDKKWSSGAIKLAEKYTAPILPVFIKGRNSILFYTVSSLLKSLSTVLLPREIFNKKGKSITIKIGNPIIKDAFRNFKINYNEKAKLLRKHTFLLKRNTDSNLLPTEKNIIHPVDPREIKLELSKSDILGFANDSKIIYLVEGDKTSVIREIARLRELTFRKVGEGTGNKLDIDKYDNHFKHIVLWDEKNLEIVGSYRIGLCREIVRSIGIEGLYNSTEFNFSPEFRNILDFSIELGRSFIQQKYWKSNALDYLWQGIGAYLNKTENVRFMFGAVSISNTYSDFAKSLIVSFYNKWHKDTRNLAQSKNRFIISKPVAIEIEGILNSQKYNDDFIILKKALKNIGYSIPVLFRRYSELCEVEGVKFMDFGVDLAFSSVVDGLILLDLSKLKESSKERYYFSKSLVNAD
jgi:putative hemolysin